MNTLVRLLLGGAFILAALAKAYKPAPFALTVEFLAELVGLTPSDQLIRWLTVSMIAYETILGCAIVAIPRSFTVHRVFAITLGFFTVVVGFLLVRTDAPSCGCFGEIMLAKEARLLNGIGLARNIALGVMLWAVWPALADDRRTVQAAA